MGILTFQPEDFTGQETAPGNDPPLSLKEFCIQAWPYLEPTQKLIWNWHLDAICDHLEAVTKGDIQRLCINMPPRCSKSMFASVMWPAWVHSKEPGARWMTGSYAMQIATRDVVKHRRLIKTDWYQRQWGKIVQLQPDQDAKTKFETTRGGFRMACSPDSAATAEGGHYVVADDPIKVQDSFFDEQMILISKAKGRVAGALGGELGGTGEHGDFAAGHFYGGAQHLHLLVQIERRVLADRAQHHQPVDAVVQEHLDMALGGVDIQREIFFEL